MNLKLLKQQWGDIKLENWLYRISVPVLSISLMVAVYGLYNDDPVVVIQPPNVSEETRVAENQANTEFKKSYAMYVASMLGNVDPGNADFLSESIEVMLHPSVYRQAKDGIADQIREIQQEDLSISFEARDIQYWSDTNRVIVSGYRTIHGRQDAEVRERLTYEMEIDVDNYRPAVTYLNVVEGDYDRRRN